MKQQYKEIALRQSSLKLIAHINALAEEYIRAGYSLSVRQLYYRLVARNVVPNNEQSYKRVASIINDGRLMGLIDWDVIEDRNRQISDRAKWVSGASILDSAASSFHMGMWSSQENRPYVIVEKAALVDVLGRVCRRFDVPILAARGYPSVSIVREMVREHLMPAADRGQRVVVLHFGDHDPSGIDMTRDLEERVGMFMEDQQFGWELRRIALNMDQVEETGAPPNPAKTTDARFAAYRKEFGTESWELDALEPQYLDNLASTEIYDLIDPDRWELRKEEIENVRSRLKKVANEFRSASL